MSQPRLPPEAAIDQALVDLLQRAAAGPLPREEIDRLLTDGYAAALEIEAERLEVMRELSGESRRAHGADIERLREELERHSNRLAALRSRLSLAAERFGRNPLAGG